PPGTYSVVATAPNYTTTTATDPSNMVITNGNITRRTFQLMPLPLLVLENVEIDDSTGNSNGKIDLDECVHLKIRLRTNGPGQAANVSATLSVSQAGASVAAATQTYPNIPTADSRENAVPFELSVASFPDCGTTLQLSLQVTTGSGLTARSFTIPVPLVI